MEQWFISAYLLSNLENRRREISLSKLSGYGDEIQLIKDLWAGYRESEYLCLLGR